MSPKETAAIEAGKFVTDLNEIILFPLIALLSGVAFLIFMYGCVAYVFNAENEQARSEGKKHILYGIIGLVIMISAYGLLTIATGTFGLNKQLDCANDPTIAGCGDAFKF